MLAVLDRHAAVRATDPPQHGPRPPGSHLIFLAAAIARTPGLPLPTPGALAHPLDGPAVTASRTKESVT